MPFADALAPAGALQAFVALCGQRPGRALAELAPAARRARSSAAPRSSGTRWSSPSRGWVERNRRRTAPGRAPALPLAHEAVELAATLPPARATGCASESLAGLTGEATLIPLFHLLRTAALHRRRGFAVRFTGLAEGTPLRPPGGARRRGGGGRLRDRLRRGGAQVNRGDW